MSFSGRARKSAQCGRGSRARAPGAQQVSATVAPLSPLEARRRDLSTIGPNGARRRCPTASRWTLNGRFGDEYGSSALYSSRTRPCTRRPVSLGSPHGVSRSSRSMTCSLAPTAVGTSPTGLSGAAARRSVSARRRAVGPTRRLCIVYTRYKVPGPMGRSREVLRGVSTVRKILTPTVGVRGGKGLILMDNAPADRAPRAHFSRAVCKTVNVSAEIGVKR